jgi:cyclophilin family peptidyl-prolyl cis-trans isomerase
VKKVTLLFVGVLIVGAIYFFGFGKAKGPSESNSNAEVNNNSTNETNKEQKVTDLKFPGILDKQKIENKKAVLKTDKGLIEFELSAEAAPKSVSNFVYLAENKFYDGLTFHRVVPGFVIQGGDPDGTGAGGPGYQFEDEPVVGEYKAGTVAMANAGADTNGSQFFICLEDLPSLPKSYNLFGQVTAGMDIVQKISVGDKMTEVTIVDK